MIRPRTPGLARAAALVCVALAAAGCSAQEDRRDAAAEGAAPPATASPLPTEAASSGSKPAKTRRAAAPSPTTLPTETPARGTGSADERLWDGEGISAAFPITSEQLDLMRADPSVDGALAASVAFLAAWRQSLMTHDPSVMAQMTSSGCAWCDVLAAKTMLAPDDCVFDLRVWPIDWWLVDGPDRATVSMSVQYVATAAQPPAGADVHIVELDRLQLDLTLEQGVGGWVVAEGEPWGRE